MVYMKPTLIYFFLYECFTSRTKWELKGFRVLKRISKSNELKSYVIYKTGGLLL